MSRQVHCFYEPGDFDEEAFSEDPSHGLVHDVNPRHTRLGDVLGNDRPRPGGGGGRPLPPDARPPGGPPETDPS